MNRIALYCYYDKNGLMTDEVLHIIKELRSVSDCIVAIINGEINDINEFLSITDDVIVRENEGLDAGAYKHILFHEKYNNIINSCDELVLCNSSFFGPFIPMIEIFERMGESDADFWGISSSEHGWMQHLQSYFIVYRKSIIKDDCFWNYFYNNISINESSYKEVCAEFELGLFRELIEHGYSYDAYVKDIRCSPYTNPYGGLTIDKLPILKKKVFSDEFFSPSQIVNSINYINDTYSYDIKTVYNVSKYLYNYDDSFFEDACLLKPQENIQPEYMGISRDDIFSFINSHNSVFIYGTGDYANRIFDLFFYHKCNRKLIGFLRTKMDGKEKEFRGYPIYKYNPDVHGGMPIIVAMSIKYSNQIRKMIGRRNNILYLWR